LTKSKRTHFTPHIKQQAMIALERNGGNLYRTAKELGISEQTLSDWAKLHQEGRLLPSDSHVDAPLDDQLEEIVNRMVAIMPEKVEEASLQELTRSLTTIIATMNQARAQKEKSGDVLEKLARLVSRYAPDGTENRDIPPPDGGGSD